MCKVLAISRSSYYHWLSNDPSKLWLENEQLLVDIQKVFEKSYQSYGSPRIREDLRVLGYKVSKSRVARIMRANNLFAKRKRKFKATTDSKHNYPVAPNLLKQDFTVSRRNEVWVSDMTYIHTKQG
jgi:transposase InsO family protein